MEKERVWHSSAILKIAFVLVMVACMCTVAIAMRPTSAFASSYSAYTTNQYTSIYTKPDSSSTKTSVWYNTKLTIVSVRSRSSQGTWYKIKYDDKTRYLWVASGQTKFSKTKDSATYSSYSKYCKNSYQKSVLKTTLNILNNWKTKYYHTSDGKYEQGEKQADGTHGFDCSGFASYVLNTVMQKTVPCYRLSANISKLPATGTIFNDASGAVKAVTVCKGKLDYSKLQPGDVLFFNCDASGNKTSSIGHCAIYIGNKRMVHSTKGSGLVMGVVMNPVFDTYANTFVKAVRYTPTRTISPKNKVMTVAKGYVKIYSDLTCNSDLVVTKLLRNTKVTLLYTAKCQDTLNAYVSYYQNGKKHYGYIYNYKGGALV